jgi:hypothetical protein
MRTRNEACEMISATDWLATLTAHIPNSSERLVRALRLV